MAGSVATELTDAIDVAAVAAAAAAVAFFDLLGFVVLAILTGFVVAALGVPLLSPLSTSIAGGGGAPSGTGVP